MEYVLELCVTLSEIPRQHCHTRYVVLCETFVLLCFAIILCRIARTHLGNCALVQKKAKKWVLYLKKGR